MPLYFFHLVTSEEYSVDDSGCELPSVERAYLEAYQAALDIGFEMLRNRRDPSGLHFEVTNEAGSLLFELPFAEALGPGRHATPESLRHDIESAHRPDVIVVRKA